MSVVIFYLLLISVYSLSLTLFLGDFTLFGLFNDNSLTAIVVSSLLSLIPTIYVLSKRDILIKK